MISFKEFLESQGERLLAEHSALVQEKERWIAAVVKLIEQLEDWVKQSDPGNIVEVIHGFRKNDSFLNNIGLTQLSLATGKRGLARARNERCLSPFLPLAFAFRPSTA